MKSIKNFLVAKQVKVLHAYEHLIRQSTSVSFIGWLYTLVNFNLRKTRFFNSDLGKH